MTGWYRNPIQTASGGGGSSWDVVWPSSATDNAIARYDTTTGKLLQNSTVLVDDTGNMTAVWNITSVVWWMTISTDTNGNLTLDPAWSGTTTVRAGSGWVTIDTNAWNSDINITPHWTGSVNIESPVLNTDIYWTAVLDEDNMISDSDTKIATQQSIKAYVDSSTGGSLTDGSVAFSNWTTLAEDNANFFFDDTNNRLGLWTNTPAETLSLVWNACINHTALENDDYAVEIDCDADGFWDVKALDINYISWDIETWDHEWVILVNIDESISTWWEVVWLDVLTTSEWSANVIWLKTGINVDPISQFSGNFEDANSILNNAVDVLTALSWWWAGNISMFVADNDTITIWFASKFEEVEIIIDTWANQTIGPTFEFSTWVGTWTSFSPIDSTNGFRNTGELAWNDSDIPTWAIGTGSEFLIRITRTRDNLNTTPIVDLIQVSSVTVYSWDKDGVISAIGTGITWTAAWLTSWTVTTNANLTGDVTSVWNATTIAAWAVDIAMLANGTDWELITWDATWVPDTVAVWTATHVLTSNWVGFAPTFQAAGGGGGFDLTFPHWIDNMDTIVAEEVNTTSEYTVPTWKTLYIMTYNAVTSVSSSTSALTIDTLRVIQQLESFDSFINFANPLMAESGAVISNGGDASFVSFTGFLVDNNTNITPIASSTSYTVPTWKKYILTNFYDEGTGNTDFTMWWNTWISLLYPAIWRYGIDKSMNMVHQPIILEAWDVVNTNTNVCNHFWYLIPTDFSI